jgi:hypothetical protein
MLLLVSKHTVRVSGRRESKGLAKLVVLLNLKDFRRSSPVETLKLWSR